MSRTPLFVRVFLVILASVVAVQLVNLALVVTVRAPFPPIYSVGQVVDALRSGARTDDRFRIARVPAPVESDNVISHLLARTIAQRLDLPGDRVRVRMPAPPGSPWAMLKRDHSHAETSDFLYELMIGDFVVSVRRNDGSWLALRPVGNAFAAWRTRALLWLLAALAVAAPLAWLMARQVARPIRLFAAAVERLGRDPHAVPIPPGGPTEIAAAVVAFNRMQARLARYVDDRTAMVRAIAHDFRTPLMRLSLRLDGAPEPLGARCRQDVAELEAMIAAVRGYVDAVADRGERRRVDLRSLVESIVDGFTDQGGAVTITTAEPVVVVADVAGVQTAIRSLIANALQFAGDAEVGVEIDDGMAGVAVRDHGPGVPVADLDHVFEPFFRIEPSRNRDTGGQGLGLASARAVALAHGGDVTIVNHPDGGVLVRFLLPSQSSLLPCRNLVPGGRERDGASWRHAIISRRRRPPRSASPRTASATACR